MSIAIEVQKLIFNIDDESNCIYVELNKHGKRLIDVCETVEVIPGQLLVDVNRRGRPVGIEIIGLEKP